VLHQRRIVCRFPSILWPAPTVITSRPRRAESSLDPSAGLGPWVRGSVGPEHHRLSTAMVWLRIGCFTLWRGCVVREQCPAGAGCESPVKQVEGLVVEVYFKDMIDSVADALDRINEAPDGADPAPTARAYYDVDGRKVSPTAGARIAGQRIWDSVNRRLYQSSRRPVQAQIDELEDLREQLNVAIDHAVTELSGFVQPALRTGSNRPS
jgi:hypothetical protein